MANDTKSTEIISSDALHGRAGLREIPVQAPFHGASTFMRRPYSRDLNNIDIAVLGLPFDLAVCNRPGARFGPQAIRQASRDVAYWDNQYPWGYSPFKRLNVVDYGDVIYQYGDAGQMVEQTQATVAEIVAAGVETIGLGGDHFITLPIIREVAKVHGPLSIIHFDAHTDTERSDNPYDHGNWFYRGVKEGLIDEQRSIQIGIRTDYDKEKDQAKVLDSPWVHRNGIDAAIAEIKNRVGDNKVYLTFDIDCVDPAFAPGTGTPVPGGLNSNQVLEIFRGLTGLNFVGMDMVEVAPGYDQAEITSLLAGLLVLEYLCVRSHGLADKP